MATNMTSMAARFSRSAASSSHAPRISRSVPFAHVARRARAGVARAVMDSAGLGGGGDELLSEDEVTLRDVTRKLVDCRRRKAAANAVDLLVSLGRAGIEPDLFAATTCLGACVASGKQDLALKVFEEVFQKGVVRPDEVVFAELIRGHLMADPPAWPRATALLSRMREQHDVTPTALSYNILLAKCADGGMSSNAPRSSWTAWRMTTSRPTRSRSTPSRRDAPSARTPRKCSCSSRYAMIATRRIGHSGVVRASFDSGVEAAYTLTRAL